MAPLGIFSKRLFVLAACFVQPVAAQQSLDAASVAQRAAAWLRAYGAAGDFSGVALLAQGDKIVFQQAYGLADPQVRSATARTPASAWPRSARPSPPLP